ncbi:MerR family transcriptional regulator [Levilactobacillus tujiorum]|uniref:MerR family transcriptional regulator n=1 Tax=Levilactobacillus tujiorum TaxID=2912243 RepID=A0ABX1L443_9LACO|nr:MerR family transcriptional regulator [Levilactobacillus tujiorum]MCH5465501.1 MerR family transcriptional regulator [Levilactobacillus tujiorum]NLR12587.1 MerR family transcriptional regulator [Lactobacillus sp. HBUAS51387]NLR29790.1 MerR family transcriptional regulator [Levilactobacillus tujiorum]
MKINEAAKQLQTSTWTLRYYEQIGVIAPITRVNGIRDYTVTDINQLQEVLDLRDCGMTLAEIKQLLRLETQDESGIAQQQLLQGRAREMRLEIGRLQESLNHLDLKIEMLAPDSERKLVGSGTH